MRKQLIEQTAQAVATQIRAVEDSIEAALMELAELQCRMIRARSTAGVAIGTGHGALEEVAGALQGLLSGVGIVGALAMPTVIARGRGLRGLMVLFGLTLAVGYVGLLLAPATLPWLWAFSLGFSGLAFPTAIALITARTRHPSVTAQLSGFVQPVGYALAAVGPFVVGLIHEATGGWSLVIVLLMLTSVPLTLAGLRVALVDPQPAAALADPAYDGREIALTDRSVSLLRALGAWARIPDGAVAPLRRMQVLNGPSSYAMQFGAAGAADGPVGRFVPNHWLRRALHDVVRAQPGAEVLAGRSVASVRARGATVGDAAHATLLDGQVLRARLVVAADTRRSRLRQQQGIPAGLHDYGQRMMVCPVEHPRPHHETATAWFEYGRTLVTLPLLGNRSSAVLTLGEADAAALLRLDDAAFGAELTRRYQGRLGPMRPVGVMSAGMMPAFDSPGLIRPGQLGPMIREVPFACA